MKGKQFNFMGKRLTLVAMITASLGMLTFNNIPVQADDHGSVDHSSGDHGQHQGTGGKRGEGKGADGRGGADSVRGKILSTMDDDSDAPAWARGNRELNPHAKGGQGQPDGAGSEKGDDYGDLWVVLRDDSGAPILDENGQIQPIIIVDGLPVVVQLTDPDGDGHYELPTEYADAVQEVELGRSNVTRSPSQVILHSLEEALSKLDGMTLTSDMLTEAGMLVVDGATIDSPLENLALYQALLTSTDSNNDGLLEVSVDYSGESGAGTYTFLVPESVQLDLAASLLAAGSDKTASLTVDRVVTVSQFLEVDDELSTLLNSYVYDGSTITYGGTTTWINVQVDGMDTPTDLSDDIYQSVEVNLITGTTVTYDGEDIFVPGVSFELVPNTVDENSDGILDANDTSDLDGIDGFTQATDDALQVIEFVHDYSVE
ncbi:MAG: hypothetical protein HUJ23_11340 [Methylophaga sp.]|nr:hypothetical protein [Methylophaga sp.]